MVKELLETILERNIPDHHNNTDDVMLEVIGNFIDEAPEYIKFNPIYEEIDYIEVVINDVIVGKIELEIIADDFIINEDDEDDEDDAIFYTENTWYYLNSRNVIIDNITEEVEAFLILEKLIA